MTNSRNLWPRTSGFLLAIVMLSGCLGSNEAPSNGGTDVDYIPALNGWDVRAELPDCQTIIAGYFVDLQQAQSMLPDGYSAQDPGLALGQGATIPDVTGKATLIFWAFDCASSASGPFRQPTVVATVDIRRPDVPGMEDEFTIHETYVLWIATPDVEAVGNRTAFGLPAVLADVDIQISGTDDAPSGGIRVSDESGVSLELEGVASARISYQPGVTPDGFHATQWFQGANGTSRADIYGSSLNRVGQPTICTVGAETPMAALFGSTTCPDERYIFNSPTVGTIELRDRFHVGAFAG